jgi:hypothetical protein
MMQTYYFHVTDSDVDDREWGDLRMTAESGEEAEIACREYLEGEIDPDGSIIPPFCLTPFTEEEIMLTEKAVVL